MDNTLTEYYITTTEKIDKLKPLDSVINKINELLEQNSGQVNHGDPIKFWIAGGAILSAITDAPTADYDIQSSNPSLMIERLRAKVDTCTEYDHRLFAHFWIDNKLIQITYQAFEHGSKILDQYDFTIVSAAYDGESLIHHPRFWQDVATKTIVIAKKVFPVHGINRVIKYTSRGYTPTAATMHQLIKMLSSRGDHDR